jgi:hypothetical protein
VAPISNKLRLTIAIFLSCASAGADSPSHWQCDKKGSIRYEYMGQTKIEKSSYCWSDNSLVSYACANHRATCKVFKPFPISEAINRPSAYGNPDFHLCLLANGTPKFIDYKTPQGWTSTSICSFDEDDSFASILYWKSSSVEVR